MLSKKLKPLYFKNSDLIRVGSKYDGGYIINKILLTKTDQLISFGINDNFDFEKHFQKLAKCPVESYDYSIGFKFWFSRLKHDLFQFLLLKRLNFKKILNIFKFIEFLFFFQKKNNKFFLKKVGNEKNSVRFNDIIKKHKKKENIFLKIDIEGSEYDFINQINAFSKIINGFVIEFHLCDKKIKLLENIIFKLSNFYLSHIHANSYSTIGKNDVPDLLELTFVNKKFVKKLNKNNFKSYPIKNLDNPNHKRHNEIKINFK